MKDVLGSFVEGGKLPTADDARMPRPVDDDQPVCAFAFDLGMVSAAPVTRQVMVAYDEVDAIKYFGEPLPPYWRRNGDGPAELFHHAAADYAGLVPECDAFDRDLTADAAKLGGPRPTRRSSPSPTARRGPGAGWRRTPTSSRCCSPRRTPATATSPPST